MENDEIQGNTEETQEVAETETGAEAEEAVTGEGAEPVEAQTEGEEAEAEATEEAEPEAEPEGESDPMPEDAAGPEEPEADPEEAAEADPEEAAEEDPEEAAEADPEEAAEADPEEAAEEDPEEAAEEDPEEAAEEDPEEAEGAELDEADPMPGHAAEPEEAEAEEEEEVDRSESPTADPCSDAPAEFAEAIGSSTIPPEDHAEFCEAFRLVSEERGHMEGREVRELMQTLGQDSNCQEAVEQMMEEQGLEADSQLSFEDVLALVSGVYRPRAQVTDDLMSSFRVFDINGNGYLEYDELYRAMFQIGNHALEESAREDFDQLVRLVDKNQDGRIDYSEFCQMVTMGVGELRRRMQED